MKVSNIKDIEKFFEVVDSCQGKVELVTGEGDRLNLKSKLSQYVSLTPLNCALNALILALNDSAAALVALLSKKMIIFR